MIGITYNIRTAYKIIKDEDKIIFKRKNRYIYFFALVFQIIVSYMFVVLNKYTDAVMLYYLSWLNTIAIVDYYTGFVYSCMMKIIYIPVAVCMLLLWNNGCVFIIEIMVVILISMILLKCMEKFCGMGEGDTDVLLVGTIFISFLKIYKTKSDTEIILHVVYECLMSNIAVFSLAGFLFFIRYMCLINWKRMTLKTDRPFVPSIYMAIVLYYILHFS